MTNEEIIREIRNLADKHKYDSVLTFGINYHMAFTDIANHIEEQAEENTKLKSENERLASDSAWLVLNKSEKELENIDLLEHNAKLMAEIEELKSELKQSIRLPLTNADKIRSVSDEELANFITSQRKSKCNDGICVGSEYCYYNNDNEYSCNSSIFEWLKSEVSE